MSTEKMREEFEAATLEIYANADLVRKDEGYRNAHIQSAWWGWKASRAAIEVDLTEVRKTTALPDRTCLLGNDVVSAIESLGLKVKL